MFLNKNLSLSITLKKLGVPNGGTALGGLVFEQSWTVTIQK